MSLSDACEFMMRRELPLTDENIIKFLDVAQEAYLIRLQILEAMLNVNVN